MKLYISGQAPRDLPPRFAKLAQQQQQQQQGAPPGALNGAVVNVAPATTNEEISLRPAKNFNLFKPNTPSNLPKSAQIPPVNSMMRMTVAPDPPKPLLNKQVGTTVSMVTNLQKTAQIFRSISIIRMTAP